MSLLPKTIYNIQRSSDGTAWEEVYISGSNLAIHTSGDGSLVGSNVIPPEITASFALTASYAFSGTSGTSGTAGSSGTSGTAGSSGTSGRMLEFRGISTSSIDLSSLTTGSISETGSLVSLYTSASLGYTTAFSVVVAHNVSNYFKGYVAAYDIDTGYLVLKVYEITGTGTYSYWVTNITGVGTSGSSGTSGTSGSNGSSELMSIVFIVN